MIETYFTDTVKLRRSLGLGPSAKPVYEDPVSAWCRKQDHIKIVRDRTGQEVTSSTEVWIRHEVGYDDLVDDRPILAIAEGKTLTGERDYWKLFLG